MNELNVLVRLLAKAEVTKTLTLEEVELASAAAKAVGEAGLVTEERLRELVLAELGTHQAPTQAVDPTTAS